MGTRGAPPPARAHLGRRETHTASNLGGGSSSAIATIGGLRRSLPTRNACAPRLQWGGGARRAGLPGRGGAFPEGRVVIGTVVPHIHVRLGRAGHGARLVWPEWRGRDPSPQRRVVIGTVLPHIHVRLGGSGQGPALVWREGNGGIVQTLFGRVQRRGVARNGDSYGAGEAEHSDRDSGRSATFTGVGLHGGAPSSCMRKS